MDSTVSALTEHLQIAEDKMKRTKSRGKAKSETHKFPQHICAKHDVWTNYGSINFCTNCGKGQQHQTNGNNDARETQTPRKRVVPNGSGADCELHKTQNSASNCKKMEGVSTP